MKPDHIYCTYLSRVEVSYLLTPAAWLLRRLLGLGGAFHRAQLGLYAIGGLLLLCLVLCKRLDVL